MASQPGQEETRRHLDRRRAVRVPIQSTGGAVSAVGARLLNVSIYGLQIESPVPLASGSELRLRLMVADEPTDVDARVVVCTAQPGLRTYFVGFEFTTLGDAARRHLAATLADVGDDPRR